MSQKRENIISFKLIPIFTCVIGVLLLLSSCKKYDPIEDSPYYNQGKEVDTTNSDWHDLYENGGTLYNNINSGTSPLINTKWILTQYRVGFGPIQYPNDTLEFTSINTYTINGGGAHKYTLSSLPTSTNYELTLYYFWPFNGSHYSGQVGYYFVDDGEINNCIFTDLQNSDITIQAFFVRIQ